MADVLLSGVFITRSSFAASLSIEPVQAVDFTIHLRGSNSVLVDQWTVSDPTPLALTVALSGSGTLFGRLSADEVVIDAFINLTKRAALATPQPLSVLPVNMERATVIVTRSPMCWLGPPLVEYHDDRSSSMVTVPSVGTNWTVVSGGTVLAVNGIPVRHSAEDEMFDGVYEP